MFLVCDLLHDPVAAAVLAVTDGVPHASVAVAVPNARSISDAEGLQPSVKLFPDVEIVGAVISAVQVAVRDAVEVLPQASIAVNVSYL
jgi:hypothetical protein